MQRGTLLAITLGVMLTVAATALAAVGPIPPPSAPVFDLDARVTPEKLPAHKLAPVSLQLRGQITNVDGTRPPALREVVLDFYRDVTIDGEGLAACRASQLRSRNVRAARQVCGKSIVGSGTAHVAIESSGKLFVVPSRLTLFSGGIANGTTTLLIHGLIATPRPMPVIASVKIGQGHAGRYGLHAAARFPKIAEGSILDFSFSVSRQFMYKGEKRSYVLARCPDGHLKADFQKVVFDEELAGGSGGMNILKGNISAPCRPKG